MEIIYGISGLVVGCIIGYLFCFLALRKKDVVGELRAIEDEDGIYFSMAVDVPPEELIKSKRVLLEVVRKRLPMTHESQSI